MADVNVSATDLSLIMSHSIETIDNAKKAKVQEALWLIPGIPIGCGIGIALHNLALGVGLGLFLGGTIAVFRVKNEDRPVSPITKIAMVVCFIAVLVFAIARTIKT